MAVYFFIILPALLANFYSPSSIKFLQEIIEIGKNGKESMVAHCARRDREIPAFSFPVLPKI